MEAARARDGSPRTPVPRLHVAAPDSVAADAPGGRRRRHLHRRRARRRRRGSITAKAPTTPRDQSRGVLRRGRAVLERRGRAAPPTSTALRPRHDRRDQRAARGRGARTALVATEGFTDVVELGRQARPRPLPAVRRRARRRSCPPERRFGAPERMAPDGVLRALDADAARALVERGRGARARGRRRRACCTPTPTRRTSGCSATRCASGWPGVPRVALARGRRHVPRVRARRDDRGRRRALAAARRATCARLARRARATRACPSRAIMQSSGGLDRRRARRRATPR